MSTGTKRKKGESVGDQVGSKKKSVKKLTDIDDMFGVLQKHKKKEAKRVEEVKAIEQKESQEKKKRKKEKAISDRHDDDDDYENEYTEDSGPLQAGSKFSMSVNPDVRVERIDNGTGYPVYKAHLLKIGEGGGTALCPFDCDCCY